MPTFRSEDLSPFGRLAVELDTAFSEMTRMSGQIQRLDIDSESGLERAVKVLDLFARNGQAVAEGIQAFSKVLQEARSKSEAAAQSVMERAEAIRDRKQHQSDLRSRLASVESSVAAANAELSGFRQGGKDLSGDKNTRIREQLERLSGDLKSFLDAAQAVKSDAARAKFKTIERDAQNLLDVLRASSRRIEKALAGE
jgi:chromosome segregation ATPase